MAADPSDSPGGVGAGGETTAELAAVVVAIVETVPVGPMEAEVS